MSIFPNSILQFHGDEEEEFCKAFNKPYIKAINVSKQEDLVNDLNKYKDSFAYLLDSGDSQNRGGTGETFDSCGLYFIGPEYPLIFKLPNPPIRRQVVPYI